MKELTLGIISSMFFAVTFILNRSMELAGGSWMWSSSLRFLFMLPFLFIIVGLRKNINQVWIEMKKKPYEWLTWSFVGFVLFYGPLTYAAAYGPGWLVAGTWQFTIVAGILLAPLFFTSGPVRRRHSIQKRALGISSIILIGVLFIQQENASGLSLSEVITGVLPVIVAAFAYPLGNRKMMEVCGGKLDTFQRVLGMTIASTPLWLILGSYAFFRVGIPSTGQVTQSFIVAVCSGVIATSLFFLATNMARHHPGKLAAVEATQSTQILFVIMGEAAILSVPFPSGFALLGILLIITGMIIHTVNVKRMNGGVVKPVKSAS
ncbi:multidrug resistance efflux transporter family protein [Rossellomorea vietnamensis]|uniref:Multidrug resistance efflux transporter family protein n=1 Tax=Rossellomorea vietnamensis TaxID=218284 RepID=A0ACD4CE28_9BACI|nr:multidrug resistance efflux transporter family protein [Rossellomorea vietnamensis]UXH46762.1 multidrug resistance efflux transporter family protein [Rossellomorea vietnamensis]